MNGTKWSSQTNVAIEIGFGGGTTWKQVFNRCVLLTRRPTAGNVVEHALNPATLPKRKKTPPTPPHTITHNICCQVFPSKHLRSKMCPKSYTKRRGGMLQTRKVIDNLFHFTRKQCKPRFSVTIKILMKKIEITSYLRPRNLHIDDGMFTGGLKRKF